MEPSTENLAEPPVVVIELQELLDRARKGDQAVLPLLREVLDDRPELWQHYGDLARNAQQAWIKLTAGNDLYRSESLRRHLDELITDLAGPNPTPLERLLANRAATCWLQVEHAGVSVVASAEAGLKVLDFQDRRQDRAHKRYLQALGALAAVRKLLPNESSEPSALHNTAKRTALRAYSPA
ncbi:MAG: hypothetical protein P4L84_05930 [Isosphaeraceae bacterium]|nr:hypothetical protein [Isosphaeraceae bacterium]